MTNDTGKPKDSEKKSSTSVSLCPTWTDLGSNTGLRGEKQAANRLCQGTVRKQLPSNINHLLQGSAMTVLDSKTTWG